MSYLVKGNTSFTIGTAGINDELSSRGCIATLCLSCEVVSSGNPTGESTFVDLHLTYQQFEALIMSAKSALVDYENSLDSLFSYQEEEL